MGNSFSQNFQRDQETIKHEHEEHLKMLSSAGKLLQDSGSILQKPVCLMVESSYSKLLQEIEAKVSTFLVGSQVLEDVVDGFSGIFMSIVREIFHGEMREFPADGKGQRTCCQCKKSGQFRYHFIVTVRYQYVNIHTEHETVDGQAEMKLDRSTCKLYMCSFVDVRRQSLEDNNA